MNTSFDGDGIAITDIDGGFDNATRLALQSDGKIVVGGIARADWALVRYNADGSLDTTFDGDGKRRLDFGTEVGRVAVTPDGKILVGGYGNGGAHPQGADFLSARFNADGSLDMTFGTNGQARADFGESSFAYGMALQSNSNVVLAGTTFNGNDYDFAVARFTGSEAAAGPTIQAVTVIHPDVAPPDSAGNGGLGTTPRISADGRFVVFSSSGNNLVLGDSNGKQDIFVRDLQTGTTTRVNVGAEGQQANEDSFSPSINAGGDVVLFLSNASNLVPGDTNGSTDIFVGFLTDGTTERVNLGTGNEQANGPAFEAALNGNGLVVAFVSSATNLADDGLGGLFIRNLQTGVTTRAKALSAEFPVFGQVSIDWEGTRVAFVSTGPNGSAVYVHDLLTGTTSLVSAAADGSAADDHSEEPMISGDGRSVVFTSSANNLVAGSSDTTDGIFVRDLVTQATTRVSVSAIAGGPANGFSDSPSISVDGRYIGFRSVATNLVAGEEGVGTFGIGYYFRDTLRLGVGATVRINVASDGSPANTNDRSTPIVSGYGDYVVFSHTASNLVPRDTNNQADVFVRNLQTGTTGLVSRRDPSLPSITAYGYIGDSGNASLTTNGQLVVFATSAADVIPGQAADPANLYNYSIYQRNLSGATATTTSLVPDADTMWVSANGRYVAFFSYADNLVPNDTNGDRDLFVLDRQTSQITRANVGNNGAQANGDSWAYVRTPPISADGRYVVFTSEASNLVAGDTNDQRDAFVRDLVLGTTSRLSVASNGTQANAESSDPSISADGRFVVFTSTANNLVVGDTNGTTDVFVRDLVAGTTTRVSVNGAQSQADGDSGSAVVSANGRYVAFISTATNLASEHQDQSIYVRDLISGTTTLVSVPLNNSATFGYSSSPSISDDGRFVVFSSDAGNLVTGDTNNRQDVFVRDVRLGTTTRLSVDANGAQANGDSTLPVISGDGKHVVFMSSADNLVANDFNGANDFFLVPIVAAPLPPNVSLSVAANSAVEDGSNNLVFTFTRDNAIDRELTVTFEVSGSASVGTDYQQTGASSFGTTGTVTFAAGASIATVTIDPTSDTTIEADETVVLTVTSGSGYIIGTDNTATATILNDDFPAVNVTVSPASVLENGATNLSYTFTRAGITNGTLTVSFSVSGTATLTTDYAQSGAATFKSTSGTVSFALGQTTKTVTINPVADTTIEADDTVILTVTPTANYSAGAANSATGTILNDDFPKITIVVSPVSVTENGSTNSVFTFTRPGPTTSALTVSFSVGGTATFNSDYTVNGATTFTASSGTVTFAAGQATKTVTVNPTGDTTVEVNETVALTITSANGYLIGTRTPVIATITNDDTAAIRLASAAIVAEQVPLPAKRDTAAIPSNWMRVFEANLNALLTALP